MAVSVRTRLPTSRAWRKSRLSAARAAPSVRARSQAVRTWPRISDSPSTAESSPDGDLEEVAHRVVVELAVEVVGEVLGRGGARSQRKSRMSW